jgi:hypothetical protein
VHPPWLELQVQKRDCFLQQFMLKLAFLMAILTPFLLGGMFSGNSWFAGFFSPIKTSRAASVKSGSMLCSAPGCD